VRDPILMHAAHRAFDRLWERTPSLEGARYPNHGGFSHKTFKARKRIWRRARRRAYAWLAGRLGIPEDRCHFSYFDDATLRRALEVCAQARPEDLR